MAQPAFLALAFAPSAFAQEVPTSPTPSPEPSLEPTTSPIESVAPSPDPSVEPSLSPSPSPDVMTPSPSPSLEPSIALSASPSPSSETTPSNPPVLQDSSPAPPRSEAEIPSVVEGQSPTPAPDLNEQLSISIVDHTAASSIEEFDLSVTETGSATLATDKADYAPTDTALITGSGFLASTTYSLTISSNDPPATSTTVSVTTDPTGDLFYAYQLDGIYRPDYKVEAFLSGTLVATITFTDSYVVGNYLCDNDAQGVNDEPGQKDLTKMCRDTTVNNPVNITWNWDEKGLSEKVGGNTGDACSLFDTDNDGYANYSMCVIIDGDPSVYQNKVLYSCGDDSADKCTNPVVIPATSVTSTCTANTQDTDPFVGGANYPTDSVASCSINLADVGGAASAKLIDVCSYPSQQPNSSPSDCIFADADKGTITINKVLVPSNDPGQFNLQVDGGTAGTGANVGNGGTTGSVEFSIGTHSISEIEGINTSLSNYASAISCTSGTTSQGSASNAGPLTVTLDKNENIICTITNTRINNGSITIIKDAVPNDAQDFSFTTTGTGLSNFSLDDDSDAALLNTKVFSNLGAGTYSVSEQAVSGWEQTSATCSDGSLVSAINLSSGENVTCTFTNSKTPTLTLIKTVTNNNGGSATSANFTPKIDGYTVTWGVASILTTGIHTASEIMGVSGYTASVWSGHCAADGTVNLVYGDNKTCTITNDDNAAHLIVVKNVINNNGGTAVASSFTTTISDVTTAIPSAPGSETGVDNILTTVGSYSVDEGAHVGYTKTLSADCNSTIALGESKTCTITNDDIPAQLTVIKHVVNDNGGNKVAGDFTINLTGSNLSNNQFLGVESPGTTVTLNAGAYGVDEVQLPGYAKTLGANCSGAIAIGESKTCTITNDDVAPTLRLIKTVINDNGGNLQVSQVPLFISGSSAVSGTQYNVLANTEYTASETQQSGYLASVWGTDCAANGTITLLPGENKTCTITNNDIAPILTFIKLVNNQYGGVLGVTSFPLFINGNSVTSGTSNTLFANTLYTLTETQQYGYSGGTFSGDCATNGTITLEVGENKTCYITNSDVQPKLTVTKVVINNNGGTKVITDFPLFVNGQAVTSGVQNGFNAGTYTVSETNQNGYTSVISGDCATNGSVALSVGDIKSCTITNDDQTGTLIVNKTVINDNGGSATPNNFSYQIDGATSVPFELDGSNSQTVDSGLYTITEPAVSGYATTYNNCERVFVPNGGSATCTITNDDQQSYITLTKVVTNDNGGNAAPNDFSLTLESVPVLSGIIMPVNPGTYTAGESLLSGYTFEGFTGDCDKNGDLTVALGQSKTCTITNNDIAPKLTLTKIVSGGSATVNDFGLTIGDTPVTSGQPLTVDANTAYSLNEAGLTGYSFNSLTGDAKCPAILGGTITLNEGDDVTCTITNTRDIGNLTVRKIIDSDGDLSTDEDQFDGINWQFTVAGNAGDTNGSTVQSTDSEGITTFTSLKTGVYNVTETAQAGYELMSSTCNGRITVAKNSSVTCTFYNTPNSTLHGYKWSDLNNNGEEDEIGEKLAGWTITLSKDNGEGYDFVTSMVTDDEDHFGWYWFKHLFPGTYKICETNQSGWLQTFPIANSGCHIITLPAGSSGDTIGEEVQNATFGIPYNFGNLEYSTVTVTKYNDENGNGYWDEGENVLSDWGMNLTEEEESSRQDSTNEEGEVIFSNILPGSYTLSEDLQDGWKQTSISCTSDRINELRRLSQLDNDNSHDINVSAGSEITCEVGNQTEPVLRIQKSNDATGSKNPGDIVTYTLVVDLLTGSNLTNVIVTDVTPDGFIYIPGSWTSSKPGVLEPNYASPGTWSLGEMVSGDVITLTYQAKISSDQDGGTYNDLAWAQGSSEGWGTILALGHDSKFIDGDGTFVGTDVAVSKSVQQTGNVNIEQAGVVLGASTQLPATGAETGWLLLALATLISGLLLIFGGKRMQKAFIGALVFLSSFAFGNTPGVHAISPSDTMSVRIEQPATPTRLNEWKLSFSVLDRANGTPVVNCYVKKPGSGSFVGFGATHTSAKTMGDNGNCQVNSSVMSEQGDYQFYVTAVSGSYTESSATVTVKYDTSGPGTPGNFSKEHPTICRWVIKFHTAGDSGATTKVEIYSSDQKNFDTNNGTRVGTVNIGSDQDGTFNHDRADNCDRQWYYVIRAFDSAGNQSGHVGDQVTINSTVPSSPTSAALLTTSANGSVLGKKDSTLEEVKEGEILGQESTPAAETVEGSGLIESAKEAVQKTAKNKTFWWILVTIIALRIVYGIARRK